MRLMNTYKDCVMAHITEQEMQEIRSRFKTVMENKINDETLKSDCFSMINQCDQMQATSIDERYIDELENMICLLEEQDEK